MFSKKTNEYNNINIIVSYLLMTLYTEHDGSRFREFEINIDQYTFGKLAQDEC